MESKNYFKPSPTDPPFSQTMGFLMEGDGALEPSNLFKLLVYTKYTSLSRFKLVDNVDDKKEFLILHGSHRTIYNLRSKLLNLTKQTDSLNTLKSCFYKEFTELLSSFKNYDSFLKPKTEDSCKLKVSTDETTNISIDYKSFKRTVTGKDLVLSKLDPNDNFILENCLELIKSKYNYDFTTLVSHWNIIYQLFLYNDHEVQVTAKDNRGIDASVSSQLKLIDSIPTIHYLYNKIEEYKSEFSGKLLDSNISLINETVEHFDLNEVKGQEVQYETTKFQSNITQRNSFETLVRSIHKTLTNNDVLLNIRILKLNKASVREVSSSIKPVFKEILDEILSYDCDYYQWIRLFRERYNLSENHLVNEVYRVFNSVLDFSFTYSLYSLTDLVIDVIFSFSVRNPNFCHLLQSFLKYFKAVLLPSTLNYASDLGAATSESYSNIWIPSLPNLDSVLTFEYLALQYPVISHKTESSTTKKTVSTVPKVGTFVVRLDIEVLDRIDFNKLYKKNPESFNFKLVLKNQNKNDKNQIVVRSYGNRFFISDPETRVFNTGSNFLSLEILFNESSVVLFTNGTFLHNASFQDQISHFINLEFCYNLENVNVKQYCTLSPGFRKYLIKHNLIHHHIFVTNDDFSTIKLETSRTGRDLNQTQLITSRSELETGGYIRKVFDYFSFFAMALSSLHTAVSNVNFNIMNDNSFYPLNSMAFESLNLMFELLLNLFELISDLLVNSDFMMLSQVGSVNVITLWRLLSESIISVLSVLKIFFRLPINMDEVPLDFLNNLSQILIESIKYKTTFKVDHELSEYHHPIDLISLANTINTISVTILASNSSIFRQLFSTSPIQVLSEILLCIAYSDSYCASDLRILAKNRTINSLNDTRCIEIFTKRALSYVFNSSNTDYRHKFGDRIPNFWWNIIYELLETDKSCLHYDTGFSYDCCTCYCSLNDLSLLDPMFNYCVFCLRKYFNYFSSITSLNYHTTKLYTSDSFYSIPRPSMLLCRLLLKHGMIIMLFNSYCTKYNKLSDSASNSEDNSKSNTSQLESMDSNDSIAHSLFEDYYFTVFEPTNLKFIENIFIYLLKTKENVLSLMTKRIELLSRYILDYFGLLLHNFISCLSLLDLLSYYSEFMDSVRVNNKYLFHLVCFSCINLLPFLIKVLLLYNKIFKAYSAKYQKFSPFTNYLVFQFSSLLAIFMKFVHFVYLNFDKIEYKHIDNKCKLHEYYDVQEAKFKSGIGKDNDKNKDKVDPNYMKDPQYLLKFPNCVTSKLDFNFNKTANDITSSCEGCLNVTYNEGNFSRDDDPTGGFTFSNNINRDDNNPNGNNMALNISNNDDTNNNNYNSFCNGYNEYNEFEVCKSLRRLLVFVQDFKYSKGSSMSFKNISEIDSFISNSYASSVNKDQVNMLSQGLLKGENWAVLTMADYTHSVHPHLVKTNQALMALFLHLLGYKSDDDWELEDSFDCFNNNYNNYNIYTDCVKYTNQVSIKILSKCQTMSTIQNLKDKEELREAYLDEVRARCVWLMRNSTAGHYCNEQYSPKNTGYTRDLESINNDLKFTERKSDISSNKFETNSKIRTTTFTVIDFFKTKVEKSENTIRRCNSSMQLNLDSESVQSNETRAEILQRSKSTIIDTFVTNTETYVDKRKYPTHDLDSDMEEITDFILNGPSEEVLNKKFIMHKLNWLVRLSLLSSINTLIYSFLDVHYTKGNNVFRHNFRPLVLDLLLGAQETDCVDEVSILVEEGKKNNVNTYPKNMNETLELFWYIVLQKMRSLVLCTLKDSKFEIVNEHRFLPNVYSRVVNDYLSGILENICDWYIRSGIMSIDSTNYTKINMNFWLGISLSFFSLLYSLGLEPMTDARYSYQIFNHLFSILHPLPMSHLKQAMSNQTSLSCYTIEAALVVYISKNFTSNFEDTVDNLFKCLKNRKFTKKDELTLDEGKLYLLVRKSFKLPELLKSDQVTNLNFRFLWSFPKIALTSDGLGQFLIYNFDTISTNDPLDPANTAITGNASTKSARSSSSFTSMEDNDLIIWRMENSWYLINEVSLTKKTSNNMALNISSSRDFNVYLTLAKNLNDRKSTEIELALVNYLGGSLEIEGINGTWSQVVGFTRFDDLYKMRVHLYHLVKYLLWVELGTNLYTNTSNQLSDNVGLVLKILFKYLRNTALQIFKLGSNCNCKDRTESTSIKYNCSNISTGFKYSKDIQGFLVDSDDYTVKPLISRRCSVCSTNLIYKKEMDFFWGNILSCLIDLVNFCNNYNLVYLVLHSLLTTFTLGERQVQAFLSMDYLGQRFCNLLVVAIKQLSFTSSTTPIPQSLGNNAFYPRKFGINNFSYLKTLLAAPKIHGVFVLKWLPPLKQVPLECIYATLRENFQSILISKPFKPTTKIEPNDPFVTLPHSEHFVTHRTCADFEADISGNTLQVIRANNLGGIVMYRIPTTLGATTIQMSANFYILNASRFGITVAPADCVFGSVPDLFERNDVVGFSHSNSLPFTSQLFAATIGYSLGDVLTSHFTIDHQEDGQLCLRTELLIGGNSIGSVLEVVYDPITQNDLSRRMSLVFIFQDPATLLLQGTMNNNGTVEQSENSPQARVNNNTVGTLSETNIINALLTSNVRRDRLSTNSTTDRPETTTSNDDHPRSISTDTPQLPIPVDRIINNNNDVVRTLDRIVYRETTGTARSTSISEDSVPISRQETNRSLDSDNGNFNTSGTTSNQQQNNLELDLDSTLDDNLLLFNYDKYFNVDSVTRSSNLLENVPEWDPCYDIHDNDSNEEFNLTLCKDEFWDKLLKDDKYTCFFGLFSDSIQIYQSVLSVNVPMFSGLKHELVSKVVACFNDLYTVLSTNFKYTTLESSVRDCFSWLCVLCCDYDREVWDKMLSRDFKVVSDFSLPFLLGSSFPSRTTLVSLSNELLLELLSSISSILTVRLVTTTMSLCSTKKGSSRFMHGDVQTDSLILTIGSKCLLASTLILKVLAHRSYSFDVFSTTRNNYKSTHKTNSIPDSDPDTRDEVSFSMSNDSIAEIVDGLVNFVVYFLSCCSNELVGFTNTTENLTFSKLESSLNMLGVDVSTVNTQASYKTHNNTLQSVELVQLDELWNSIYNSNLSFDLMDSLVNHVSRKKGMDQPNENVIPNNSNFNIKMFASSDKNFHLSSKIPSVRRHFMRRSKLYNLIEHDTFDLLQSLVQVFGSYFTNKIKNRCTTTLGLFRSSLVHFSSTFEANSMDYWDCSVVDRSEYKTKGFKNKMDLFSRASDPLYSWQLLFYNCYKTNNVDDIERISRVLMTELAYCTTLAISSFTFEKLFECIYWILDILVRHPLCPYKLRYDLTNKSTINLLYFLFVHGIASPPKLAQVSTRIIYNIIPNMDQNELEHVLFLSLYFGTCGILRVHSICNYYSTSDLDMFTNFEHFRLDHATRLSTANILHSFLTTFVLVLETINQQGTNDHYLNGTTTNKSSFWDDSFTDFYNMGLYLYLARNKQLTKSMLSGLLSLPVKISTNLLRIHRSNSRNSLTYIPSFQNSLQDTSKSPFRSSRSPPRLSTEVTPSRYMESVLKETNSFQKSTSLSPTSRTHTGTPLLRVPENQLNISEDATEVYYVSCSNRYFGVCLNMGVRVPTRFVFSQYRDFSKVFAELVVCPTKTMDLLEDFHLLDEYTFNVPFTMYKLKLNSTYAYKVGYTSTKNLDNLSGETFDQVYKTENQIYLSTDSRNLEMYIRNGYIFWNLDSKMVSAHHKDLSNLLPFVYLKNNLSQSENTSQSRVNNNNTLDTMNIQKKDEGNQKENRIDIDNRNKINKDLQDKEKQNDIVVDYEIIIPVNKFFFKTHEDRFEIKKVGNGCVVTPTIRTGLSVHNSKASFPNATLIDLTTSSLVRLNTDLLMNMKPDNTLKFDPCLPFRVAFKFDKGFDSDTRVGFYVGLISKNEKILWYSNGDLYLSTNFHVPCKNNEFRKIKCIPYSENDIISLTFDPNTSSLYLTNNDITSKLNFFNYYYHITNVHTNDLINSNKDKDSSNDMILKEKPLIVDVKQVQAEGNRNIDKTINQTEDEGNQKENRMDIYNRNKINKDLQNKEKQNDKNNLNQELNFTYADRRSLINAIIFDDMAKIKEFLDFPCDLFEDGCDDHFDMDGDDYFLFSPIYIVANLGKLSTLKLIATNKNINFDIKSGPFKTTPLMGAVKAGHYNVVYYLLTVHSLDINTLDSMGNNCLYYSIHGSKHYDFKIAELLLNFGVKVQPHDKPESVLDILENIPGNASLHRKLLDEYKLQSLVVNKANWPLLQNLQVVMSSKVHVKYKIKVDPPVLAPIVQTTSSPPVTSPGFLSPERRPENVSQEDTSVFQMVGNILGSLSDDVVKGFKNTMDGLTDAFTQTTNIVTSPTAKLSPNNFQRNSFTNNFATPLGSNFNSMTGMTNYISMGSNLSNTSTSPGSNSNVKVLNYLTESLGMIRRDLLSVSNGLELAGFLNRNVTNELNLSPKDLVAYYLSNYVKALSDLVPNNKLLKNFTVLTNKLTNDLVNCSDDNTQLLLRYIKYENELVSFGVAKYDLRFSHRLEKNGPILTQLGILDSFAQQNTDYVYISTNEDFMQMISDNKMPYRRKKPKAVNLKATGSFYVFDLLRLALNQCLTFEIDRCLVCLLDLLRNSNKQLVTLVKILVFSNTCKDVQRYLPPSDSQLWSNVNITIENIYNNIHTLRKKVLTLVKTYPLSHIDLQLLHTVLCKSLQEADILKNLEIDQNIPVESKLLSILEQLELSPSNMTYSRNRRGKRDTGNINTNYTFNFTDDSGDFSMNNSNSMSIRALSSPHLINRVDSDFHISQPTSASRLYQDILNNKINSTGENVLHLDTHVTHSTGSQQLEDNSLFLSSSQNVKGLETNFVPNFDGSRDGRGFDTDYLFHCLSLVLLADRLKYFDIISDIFRNVIPIVSTILNQPKIEYKSISSLVSQTPASYYGTDDIDIDLNKYGVCLGATMPIHFSYYLKNKPLIKKTTLNQMYDKIFTLKTLNVDRPYFSIRVDRGIAHTTKLLKNSLWFQSTNQILNCNPNILRAKNNQRPFMVVFKGEGSTDFGGPFQELLTCISNEFMSPLAPETEAQTATIKCQNTINNYGMHQDTVLIKFNHHPMHKFFNNLNHSNGDKDNNNYKSTHKTNLIPDSDESNSQFSEDSLFTLGCCDLGICCPSGCCNILPPYSSDEPINTIDFGTGCKCGASELYSDTCNQNIPMELSMYESVGRLCAMCVCMMNPLNIAINPIIWKKLLCSNLSLIDLLDCDKMSVDLLQRLHTLNSIGAVSNEDLDGLVFSIEGTEGSTIDLVENGSNLPVVPDNLDKYLNLTTMIRLTEGDLGCSFFAKGINSVIPIGRLRTLLDPRSLEFIVCGDSIVDLSILRAHTVSYSLNLKRDLFDVLARLNNEMLQLFLRFVSGRSRLPHPNSDWCLRLEYDNKNDSDPDSRLPTSATCSFRLLMPKYSSLDIMHNRLIYAIENCIAIDLDAHVVHDEMQLSIN